MQWMDQRECGLVETTMLTFSSKKNFSYIFSSYKKYKFLLSVNIQILRNFAKMLSPQLELEGDGKANKMLNLMPGGSDQVGCRYDLWRLLCDWHWMESLTFPYVILATIFRAAWGGLMAWVRIQPRFQNEPWEQQSSLCSVQYCKARMKGMYRPTYEYVH